MKSYWCKVCIKKGKVFRGTREEVRKHIKEDHRIKGYKKVSKAGSKYDSPITSELGKEDI